MTLFQLGSLYLFQDLSVIDIDPGLRHHQSPLPWLSSVKVDLCYQLVLLGWTVSGGTVSDVVSSRPFPFQFI